jgi:hypothetical protein
MINCCVNPDCGIELKDFNSGNLYALERRSADTEFFWLCLACASMVTVHLDPQGSVTVKPRSEKEHCQPPHPDNDLCLIPRFVERSPRVEASRARGLMFPGELRRRPPSSSYKAARSARHTYL